MSQYVKGTFEPKQDRVELLAKALQVSEAWLMGVRCAYGAREEFLLSPEKFVENILQLPSMQKIPVIGTIACETPILAQENIETYADVPENIHADFCLRLRRKHDKC